MFLQLLIEDLGYKKKILQKNFKKIKKIKFTFRVVFSFILPGWHKKNGHHQKSNNFQNFI